MQRTTGMTRGHDTNLRPIDHTAPSNFTKSLETQADFKMAPPVCGTSPCWALPLLFEPSPASASTPSEADLMEQTALTESRLLALRRRMESGDHKHNKGRVFPPPSLPPAAPKTEEASARPSLALRLPSLDSGLVTPKPAPAGSAGERVSTPPPPMIVETPATALIERAPLVTPPTPGRKRRFVSRPGALGGGPPVDFCPPFLPLGSISRHCSEQTREGVSAAAAAPNRSAQEEQKSGGEDDDALDSPKRYRVNPRYDSPWLSGAGRATEEAVASSHPSAAVAVGAPPLRQGSCDDARRRKDADLLAKLRSVAEIMSLRDPPPASAHHAAAGVSSPGSRSSGSASSRHSAGCGASSSSDRLVRAAFPRQQQQGIVAHRRLSNVPSDPLKLPLSAPSGAKAGEGKSASPRIPIPGGLPEKQERVFKAMSA